MIFLSVSITVTWPGVQQLPQEENMLVVSSGGVLNLIDQFGGYVRILIKTLYSLLNF